MVHLRPSKGSGERRRQAGSQATEHLHHNSTALLHRRVSINSRPLVNTAPLHPKADMGNLRHSSMALHRLSNPDMAPLHLSNPDTAHLHLSNTAPLLASNTVLPRVSARPLSLR
jgi:hypothetical protein